MTKSHSWTVNFLPEGGGRLTGKLEVSAGEVAFRALYDSSFKTIAKNIGLAAGTLAASGGAATFLRDAGEDAEIVIPAAAITDVQPARKGLMKRVVVTTGSGEDFLFEYGMLSVGKIVDAIHELI